MNRKRGRGLPAEARRKRGLPAEARRRRGGQPGNQNARKHGFYSATISPEEISAVWNEVNLKGINPYTSVIRVKLAVALQSDPSNHRLLEDAAKLLTKKCRSEHRMDAFDARQLRAALLGAFEVSYGLSPDSEAGIPTGRIERALTNVFPALLDFSFKNPG